MHMHCRRTRCGPAQHKQTGQTLDPSSIDRADPQNCNVYVGNVALDVTDAQLRHVFERYGNITDVKIYRQGGFQRAVPALRLLCSGSLPQMLISVCSCITIATVKAGSKPLCLPRLFCACQ